MTNFEYINSLDIDEMAKILSQILLCMDCPNEKDCKIPTNNYQDASCRGELRAWLDKEVIEDVF